MKLSHLFGAGVSAIALTSAVATVAHAQQITTEIRGNVTDDAGAPVSGARVAVTDTRTGTTRTTTTNSNGIFSVRNLTSGGPYNVSVSSGSFRGETIEGVFTSISSATVLTFDLETGSAAGGDEIVVVASRRNVAELAIGPSSTFGLETIEALPSISRDIRDIIRVDPRLTVQGGDDAVQCLGGNNRFNSFTLDGVQSNDAFGLNASGLPSRANFPVPFDAIRETAVEFAPYDVEYGQFTGCNVNIITKSGSNEFHGAAFAVFNSQSLTGSTIDGNVVSDTPFRDYNWGASIGGPIIKDKLFFFVAYEEIDDGGTIISEGPEGAGFVDPVLGFTLDEANQLSSIASSVYGIDNGGIPSVVPETSRRITARGDWNITDNHRLEFTYSREREEEVEPDLQDAEFQFLNSYEISGSSNEFYSARLFSQWTDNLSTELRVSRRDNEDIQNPVGGGEAQDAVPIPRLLVDVGALAGEPIQVTGPGIFRSANELNTQTDQIKAKFDYVTGNHAFTGGYELNDVSVFNLFAINATGEIIFDSIADFEAGLASSITQNGSFSGDINDAAAEFSRSIHSLYFQDEWTPTDELTVTLGLRYDFYTSGDTPTESQAFINRYGFSNSVGFDNLDVLLPRLGINYDAGETFFGETQFRAGAGVFSGGDPTVWFSNAFTNFGGGLGFGSSSGAGCTPADLQVLDGGTFTGIPACIAAQQQTEAGLGAGRLDAIDPNFDIPSLVRGSFGFTHNTNFNGSAGGFFDDWRVDVDVIYSRRRNAP
ncbi:MAG: TonB-dependent receptor, partial [Pseudomonadota bacterium]